MARVQCRPAYASTCVALLVNGVHVEVTFDADGYVDVPEAVAQALVAVGPAFCLLPVLKPSSSQTPPSAPRPLATPAVVVPSGPPVAAPPSPAEASSVRRRRI